MQLTYIFRSLCIVLAIIVTLMYCDNVSGGEWVKEKIAQSNNDGNLFHINKYTYDDNGNIIRYEYDMENDGVFERIKVHTYDDNNNRIKYEDDYDADGTIDSIDMWEYDAHNNEILRKTDNDADGIFDSNTITTWKYIE